MRIDPRDTSQVSIVFDMHSPSSATHSCPFPPSTWPGRTARAVHAHRWPIASSDGGPDRILLEPTSLQIEERIRIDGRPVDGWVLDDALRHVRRVCESDPDLRLSFYELTFLLAMTVFKQLGVVRCGGDGSWWASGPHLSRRCRCMRCHDDITPSARREPGDIAMGESAIRRPVDRSSLCSRRRWKSNRPSGTAQDGMTDVDGWKSVISGRSSMSGPIPLNHEGPTRMPRS